MRPRPWLPTWLSAKPRTPVRHVPRTRLATETLEDRAVPSAFDFADFRNAGGLNLLGSAAVTADGRLRLTPAAQIQSGAAWYVAE